MIVLENNSLRVSISEKGAELQEIFNKETQLDYLWSGDATYWGKKSPVLFPIVGTLKNNSFHHNGNNYSLNRHGFARDMDFKLTESKDARVCLSLDANQETLAHYPFIFRLNIIYELNKNQLSCTYEVINIDIKPMYFSIGAHPAFKVPLEAAFEFSNYQLVFNEKETEGKWPISEDGLIEEKPLPFFNNNNEITLTKELFYGDALVFKHLKSNSIELKNNHSKHGFVFSWKDFPFMGIWSAKNAPFVCIEPWCGIADSVNTTGELRQKEGMNLLVPGETFNRTWSVTVY
ncbi:aldose 1-epimerase family protein [Sediminibacterium sp. TEGAF015]|uniref:aldose 1-epimerase family protein n=1 Tax=Sediminibacterium sp. TEGAF015 TaxID=575378 RepID=UPI0021FBEEFC|nr:aldose 1-epimerase family protein [Sediminibacterium sp. TEGAF015]BDQ12291.1 LACX protein [Sediminibacterium sp. TEGAF015]